MFSSKEHYNSYYFIGIGGVSMSALAQLLKQKGFRVRGSDGVESETVRRLRRLQIPVSIGDRESIHEDTVVYNSAIQECHPQLQAAKCAGLRLLTRAELLGAMAKEYPYVLSVAGSHGKTTCTAMLSHIFSAAARPFTCHIGGYDRTFGNFATFGNEYFITEACEYKRNFLTIQSDCAILLNTDLDHTDYYRDKNDLLSAYSEFTQRAKHVIARIDDEGTEKINGATTFGFTQGDYHAANIRSKGERYSFTVVERSIPLTSLNLSIVGKVNVLNALAACAAARRYGISAHDVKKGIESFCGVQRRFELIGTHRKAEVYCDYAHHPREIAASIHTANQIKNGRLYVVFQPHTYSRTRDLMNDFISVLQPSRHVIIYETYSAREEMVAEGSARVLANGINGARYASSPEILMEYLSSAKRGDVILFLGAGDIYEIANKLFKKEKTP